MKGFDKIIHQPARLRIMTQLCLLDEGEVVDFTFLKKLLELTDGNLGAHLEKLDGANYVEVEKTFVGRKPKTFLKATLAGRAAYEAHRKSLEAILQGKPETD